MKQLIFFIFSIFFSISSFGQRDIDAHEFAKSFKQIFDASISGLEKIKNDVPILTSADEATISFDENKDIFIYRAEYGISSKEEAKTIKKELAQQVLLNVPTGDYKHKESYGAEYFDYLKYTFEFDTTTFAEIKKRPVIQIGILKNEGAYTVELLILEPYFKNQY